MRRWSRPTRWRFSGPAFLLCILAVCRCVVGATTVGGFITTDTHWQAADSPFIASSSVLIDSGATLTIDPGVEVRFAPTTGLVVVDGTLSARGTSESPITFTADQPGDENRWNGIGFGGETVDAVFDGAGNYLSGSVIEQATVEAVAQHNNGSINVQYSSPYIHASIIQDNLSCGIKTLVADGLRIVGNQIRNNNPPSLSEGGGIDIRESLGVLVADNEITGNRTSSGGGGGIHMVYSDNSVITGNAIDDNSGSASFLITSSDDLSINANIVSGGGAKSGIYIDRSRDVAMMNNMITGDNSVAGLSVYGGTNVTLVGDEIVDNVGDGIRFMGGTSGRNVVISGDAATPTVIAGNGGFQIYNDQTFGLTTDPLASGNVDARNVWWGTTDTATIQAGIFDFFDNSSKGIVFVEPFALSESPHGDYNHDGFVDAADYTVWRDTLGMTGTGLDADGDGSGEIDETDFLIWRQSFGREIGGAMGAGNVAGAPIPEPRTLMMLLAAVLMVFPLRHPVA
jgi:parallel beta-helix repeat protein